MTKIFLIPFGIVLIFTASFATSENLQNLSIFLGRWISQEENSVIIEVWESTGSFTYEGYSYSIDKIDGSEHISESMRLVEMSGEIFYLAKVEQNEFPVPFKLSESSRTRFVFENPEHDFPKRIEYNFVTDKKLEVTVGNGYKSFKIHFEKEIENEK